MSSSRFPNLNVPVICTTDVAQIAAETIGEYEQDWLQIVGYAKTLAPGEPVRIIELRQAARECQFRSLLNFAYQQNFIITAIADDLDAIGSNYGDKGLRLQASSAVTTLRFTLASAVNTNIPINAGTTVSAGPVQFSTITDAILLAGSTTVDIPAQCAQTGIIGNGYVAGQVNQLTNWALPYVVSVANTTTSIGGADREADDPYAQRLWLVPGAFSVAGPVGAYKYWAFTASPSIIDVSIVTPDTTPSVAAGHVDVYTLLQGGVIPNSSFLALVQAVFSNDIRPLGDVVTAQAPIATNYNVSLTYYIDPVNVTLTTQIQAAVNAAITTFINYTKSRIGRTISQAYLERLIMEAGASDVVVTTPTDTTLDAAHVGVQSGSMSITYGGLRPG